MSPRPGFACLVAIILSTAARPGAADPASVEQILALGGDPAYGEYLASECVTCHGTGGAPAIPRIDGLAQRDFVAALLAYRSGERTHQIMQTVARSLSDDEIAALAAYFAGKG